MEVINALGRRKTAVARIYMKAGSGNITVNKREAEALRLAISRALCEINPEYRPTLKAKGLMRRDPRMVERKKPGQPGARKKFQFSKR